MRFVRSLWEWAREDRTWIILALLSFVIIGFGQAGAVEVAGWVPTLVGLWMGFLFVHIAFRFFGWGKFAANLLWGVGLAGAMAMLFAPGLLFGMTISTLPTWAKVAYAATWGFLIGFGGPARAIARQRSNTSRRS